MSQVYVCVCVSVYMKQTKLRSNFKRDSQHEDDIVFVPEKVPIREFICLFMFNYDAMNLSTF